MIYSTLALIVSYLYPFGSDTTSDVVIGTIFLANILISVIMLPINIRLAGQLVMQVFKYRYICNYEATMDEDNIVMTGYYNHFRAVMCIIIAMVGYNVFNVISAVLFLIDFFKNAWGEVWWYWWIAQGLCAAFQECIILYAVAMLYQVACYVQGKKFNFLTISVFMGIRFIYTSILVGILENAVSVYWYETYIIITILEICIPCLLILESSLRFLMIFSFVRVTQRSVSKYITDFINDMNTPYLDREHFVVKVQAGKLLQIAGWGTICVSFLTSFVLILQYSVFLTGAAVLWDVVLESSNYNTTISLFLSAIAIIQMMSILPSILYSAFLIILWLYFRYKTKVKYSGYSSDDPKVLKLIHQPETDVFSNQDKFHFTYYKHKNRVMITTYVVCVVLVSVMFAAFFAPVLSEKWKWDISLKQGDYYLLEKSVLKDGCSDDRFSFTVNQGYEWFSRKEIDLNCSENIFAGELLFNETFYRTYNYIPTEFLDRVWLPENSTVESDLTITIQSEYPCYYDFNIYSFIYDHNMVNQLGIDSCIGAKIIQDPSQQNFTTCNYTQRGQQHCKILTTGMYYIDGNITVQQFGYQILEHTLTPLNKVKGEQLSNYDVILFNSSENTPNNTGTTFCSIHASCLFNPFFRILMPVPILLCSMIALTIGLILIHKI